MIWYIIYLTSVKLAQEWKLKYQPKASVLIIRVYYECITFAYFYFKQKLKVTLQFMSVYCQIYYNVVIILFGIKNR